MSTPYRAIEGDHGSWHTCQDCDWAADHGAEDHCERTGHRVRAERWSHFEKHCEVEAELSVGDDRASQPPGIGKALFYEPGGWVSDESPDFFEVVDDPDWEELRMVASRMMVATEDTHHCFLEAFYRLSETEPATWRIRSRAIEAGHAAHDLQVYRFSMGS